MIVLQIIQIIKDLKKIKGFKDSSKDKILHIFGYEICIFKNDSLVSFYDRIGFEDIFVSPDSNYCLCVATQPYYNYKYFVIDHSGKIIKSNFFFETEIIDFVKFEKSYLSWYLADNPGVNFIYENNKLVDITINSNQFRKIKGKGERKNKEYGKFSLLSGNMYKYMLTND